MNFNCTDFLGLACEILSRGNKLRFQARGESMYPFIMDGDILEIEPVREHNIKVGDVIFYRDGVKQTIAHRIVKKITQDNRTIFLARGDSNTDETERVYAEQILGRINAIERSKKRIVANRGLNRFMYVGYSRMPSLFAIAKRTGSRLLPHIQGPGIYRHLAKKFIKAKVLYQWESDGDSGKDLLAKVNNVIIGKTNIDNYSKDSSMRQGWWIFGMWVHWRYRGLGIGRRLTEMACGYAAEHGASIVKLLIFKDNKPALNLYRKMGFYQISIPGMDEQLKEEARQTRRERILMKKSLIN